MLQLAQCPADELRSWIVRIAPSELLHNAEVTPAFEQQLQLQRQCAAAERCQRLPELALQPGLGLRRRPGRAQALRPAAGCQPGRLGRRTCRRRTRPSPSALLDYAEHTQGQALAHVGSCRFHGRRS